MARSGTMQRDAGFDIKIETLLILAAVGIGGYLIWRAVSSGYSFVSNAAGAAVDAIANPIANLWLQLTAAPSMNVLGNVVFPNGQQLAISTLPVRTDNLGNVYVNAGGVTYQLQPSNAQGNWPAVAVGT